MKTLQGPGLFLAQFVGDAAPFNSLPAITGWAASLGYRGVQIPTWDARLFDLALAADSQTYCDEVAGQLAAQGLVVTELSTHLQGQLLAVHPAYDRLFDGFAAAAVRGDAAARSAWAAGRPGGRAIATGRAGLGAAGPEGACHLLGRAGLALALPLAAAPGRPGRRSLCRAGTALAACPGCL